MMSGVPAWADTMTWEMDGTLLGASGVFAQYLPANAAVTLTLFGDADQQASIPPQCPPSTDSANFTLSGGQLQVGDFTWTTPGGIIERHNEAGHCGAVGAPLDLMSFGWTFVGTPPVNALKTLFQVYASLSPVNDFAATLGEQLNAVHNVPFGSATGLTSGSGGFQFSGDFKPVPEPATVTLLGLGIVGLAGKLRAAKRAR